MGVAGPAGPPLGEGSAEGSLRTQGIDLEGLAGERRCPVWGRAAPASQSRVLWPEEVGNLRGQRSQEMALEVGGASRYLPKSIRLKPRTRLTPPAC